jgi:hypothetical protein
LVKRGRHSKFALKPVEEFLLGYDSNTKSYRVFNKSSRLVEVTSDIVFGETNGSLSHPGFKEQSRVHLIHAPRR